jgi:hypothetical protein
MVSNVLQDDQALFEPGALLGSTAVTHDRQLSRREHRPDHRDGLGYIAHGGVH